MLQKSDQDVYGAISIGIKMNTGEKVLRSICLLKELDKKTADYWFYKILTLNENLTKEGPELLNILDYCEVALEIDKTHWPLYYLRSYFMLLLQEGLKKEDETIEYLIPGYRDAKEHLCLLDDLVNLQKACSAPELFMTYCLIALVHLDNDDVDAAIESLRKGLEETEAGKVKYLAYLFNIPVYEICRHQKLRNREMLKQVKLRFKTMALLG